MFDHHNVRAEYQYIHCSFYLCLPQSHHISRLTCTHMVKKRKRVKKNAEREEIIIIIIIVPRPSHVCVCASISMYTHNFSVCLKFLVQHEMQDFTLARILYFRLIMLYMRVCVVFVRACVSSTTTTKTPRT